MFFFNAIRVPIMRISHSFILVVYRDVKVFLLIPKTALVLTHSITRVYKKIVHL